MSAETPHPTSSAAPEEEPDDIRHNIRAGIERQHDVSLRIGEAAYARAFQLESLHGLSEDVVQEYRRAGRYLVDVVATDMALETTTHARQPNPVTFFKIADSFKKQATAPELAPLTESQQIARQARLSGLAIHYWDRGVEALLEADPDSLPDGIEIPENRSELVASSIAEAVQDIDNAQRHGALVSETSEHELAAHLEANGPEQILDEVTHVRHNDSSQEQAKLEIVSLSSQRLNQELTGTHHFHLTA